MLCHNQNIHFSDVVSIWQSLPLIGDDYEADLLAQFSNSYKNENINKKFASRVATHSSKPTAPRPKESLLQPTCAQRIDIFIKSHRLSGGQMCDALKNPDHIPLLSQFSRIYPKNFTFQTKAVETSGTNDAVSKRQSSPESFISYVMTQCPSTKERLLIANFIHEFPDRLLILEAQQTDILLCSQCLYNSKFIRYILSWVLTVGNRLNMGTNFGDAVAFKLDILPRLKDVRSCVGKNKSLMHFLVSKIHQNEVLVSAIPDVQMLKRASKTCLETLESGVKSLQEDLLMYQAMYKSSFENDEDDLAHECDTFLNKFAKADVSRITNFTNDTNHAFSRCCKSFCLDRLDSSCSHLFGSWAAFIEDFQAIMMKLD
ncbi:hypothetical protein GJ496_000036 [Pomphorhynchus laevis]|nr:hypothetical protein GJ496_000036 [Pomphorhynchus laevis]